MDLSKVREVINLTPHDIRLCVKDGAREKTIIIPNLGKTARMRVKAKAYGTIPFDGGDIPVVKSNDEEITNVPPPKEGVVYIVSSVIAKSLKREDVLSPDTTNEGVLRDGNGSVYAVKRLQCFGGKCAEVLSKEQSPT